MSYDISFRCVCCSRYEGAPINYTYNLAPMFRWALGGDGLRDLDGLPAAEAIPRLEAAIAKCETDDDLSRFDAPNGWGSGAGALAFLRKVLGAAREAVGNDVLTVS